MSSAVRIGRAMDKSGRCRMGVVLLGSVGEGHVNCGSDWGLGDCGFGLGRMHGGLCGARCKKDPTSSRA